MKPGQRVIVELRRLIAAGEVKDGERIAEIATAARLGVSRMPVRTALRALEQEGLVVKLGARGYAARGLSPTQIADAVEVRGVLEGLAARRLALNGLGTHADAALSACLAQGDAIFAKGCLVQGDLEHFYDYNLAFHDLIVGGNGNAAIAIALARNNHLPFASATALALDWNDLATAYQHLHLGHRQHIALAAAIRRRDAPAAERLMREHAQVALASDNTLA